MTATGLGYPATRPSLGRLAHIRAVVAARLWLAATPAWTDGRAWWHSERRLRADHPAAGRPERNKAAGQATIWAEITDATLRALPGILNPGQDGYDDTSEHASDQPELMKD